jgi:hypothetical protein
MASKRPKASELIKKIGEGKGNVSAVARAFGVTRAAVYKWSETTPTAKEALADERETMVYVAESALYRNVVQGENSAIFYVLNNSPEAKRRGWGPKIEHSGDVSLVVKRLKGDASMDNI